MIDTKGSDANVNLNLEGTDLEEVTSVDESMVYIDGIKTSSLDLSVYTGRISVKGSVYSVTCTVKSYGAIDITDISVTSSTMTVDGNGVINCGNSNVLTATVNDGGSMTYTGNPTLTKTIQGSGSIESVNSN